MKLIDVDASDYVASLGLTEEPQKVYSLDGAHLVRIAEDHYLVVKCSAHPEHKGDEYLIQVLPQGWVCFHSAANPAEEFEVHHYGPED